jgi:hypothetical protein
MDIGPHELILAVSFHVYGNRLLGDDDELKVTENIQWVWKTLQRPYIWTTRFGRENPTLDRQRITNIL